MSETALECLARFVAENVLTPDQATTAILRDGVIDTLGCMIVGAKTDVAQRCLSAAAHMGGGGGPSRVVGSSECFSRPHAAFLNEVAGHALDFDDWEIPGNTHPTVVLLPALLAVAERNTSGEDLVRAYLAGFEVIARLGEALNFEHYDAGWHSTATLGALGAAAGCARLMGLNPTETTRAMSLACSSAAGYTCQFGSNAKPVQAGFAARAGVEAACLAKAGLSAQPHMLDHPSGLAALMGGFNADRLEQALQKTGTSYALSEHGLVLKPWPSCGYTHRIMTCALAIRARIQAEEISQVILHMPDFHAAILPFRSPKSRAEALFSAPFVVSIGLLEGDLTLADLESEAWKRPPISELIVRCDLRPFSPKRPDLNYSPEDPDRIEVILRTGERIEECCVYPVGAPDIPMTQRDVLAKFKANLGQMFEANARCTVWIAKLQDWPQAPSVLDLFFEEGFVR
ncbi:MmgE/PrpD family protein [Ruegeria sp. R13_0]|uniref:MmgE/PrpD family protein n=1 Tax=Ruegeria sp. R13_0 TaxID=2821099 RepID=UPI001ADC9781|nr:MmgE/PrpD family protein [Ruegeria sp. R13_0]MBO9433347.1 MmgE/PrpD family protein [Ruegeria sp. R13_0]